MRPSPTAILAALLVGFAPVAQETGPAEPAPVTIRIVCENWGDPVPRRDREPEDGNKELAFFLVGHQLRWEVGPKRFRSAAKLRGELERLRAKAEGEAGPDALAIVLQPGKSVCVSDVVLTLDQVREAGVERVSFDRVQIDFGLRRISASSATDSELTPPTSKRATAGKPGQAHPQVRIDQQGRMYYKRHGVYDPEKHGANFESLIPLLLKWRQDARSRGNVEDQRHGGRPKEIVNEPVLIRADKWTEWYYVAKFLQQCTTEEAAFWRVELGVTEEDLELKRRQEPFKQGK